jgi:hypothetical protein
VRTGFHFIYKYISFERNNASRTPKLKRLGNMSGSVHVECVTSYYRRRMRERAIFRQRYTIVAFYNTTLRPKESICSNKRGNEFAPKIIGILNAMNIWPRYFISYHPNWSQRIRPLTRKSRPFHCKYGTKSKNSPVTILERGGATIKH